MLVSVAWLREIVGLDDAPAEIARLLTARGLTVDAIQTTAHGDAILDIDVPANRPDCLGHVGIGREWAAARGRSLPRRPAAPAGVPPAIAAAVSVRVEAPDLCARYTAALVRGVRVGPSPERVRARLEACGVRSINNVVDATNLVLLETGHPIHAFDLARVAGATVVVRRAREGERLVTLDGVERPLAGDMLVIADVERPIALAGVMGGADSEITDATRDVLVEAAWFLPRSVRQTARRLGLSTDASQRFERGADPEGVLAAQAAALRWIVDLAGGSAADDLIDVYPAPRPRRSATVRLDRAATLLGYPPTRDEALAALEAVALAPVAAPDGSIGVTVPSWRVDLEREVDLIEEIGRHLGYDRIPARRHALEAGSASSGADPSDLARDVLAHQGFHEALNYAMIGPGEDAPFVAEGAAAPIRLANPLSESLGCLRRSLLPGLLRAVALNLRRGTEEVRLFEVGSVFADRGVGAFPAEPLHAAFAWTGSGRPPHWSERSRPVDVHDGMGVVESVLRAFRPRISWEKGASTPLGLHPGRSLSWAAPRGAALAWCGEVHPDLAAALEIPARVLVGEIDLGQLASIPAEAVRYRPAPRFPRVVRDLAVVLDPGVFSRDVLGALACVASPAPVAFDVVDRYVGPPLGPGEVCLTVRVILEPDDRTLTEVEIEGFRGELLKALERGDGFRPRIDTRSD